MGVAFLVVFYVLFDGLDNDFAEASRTCFSPCDLAEFVYDV